jgi:hypothetical protein
MSAQPLTIYIPKPEPNGECSTSCPALYYDYDDINQCALHLHKYRLSFWDPLKPGPECPQSVTNSKE